MPPMPGWRAISKGTCPRDHGSAWGGCGVDQCRVRQRASECVAHLRETITGGRIRPTLTVFHPSAPHRPGPRIWNEQLTRYAGYQVGSGVVGDPRNLAFTERVRRLGWAGGGGRFDVLPLVVQAPGQAPRLYELPADVVHQVPLSHPRFDWFA